MPLRRAPRHRRHGAPRGPGDDGRAPTSSRSSAATRAPASCSRSARASPACSRATTSSASRSSRAAAAAGTARPAARTCATSAPHVPARGHDHRRHLAATTSTARTLTSWPSSAPSPSTRVVAETSVIKVDARPAAGAPWRWCRAAWRPAGARPSSRAEVEARRHRRRRRHRRHRHQRRAGRPAWPAPSASSPSTRSSSSGRRRWSSAPRTPASSMDEAMPLVQRAHLGQMADKVIMTPGVMYGDLIGRRLTPDRQGRHLRRHRRRADDAGRGVRSTCSSSPCGNKEIKGTIFGSLNPRRRHPEAARRSTARASSSSTS